MSDYLTNLSARITDPAASLRPRVPSLFEPVARFPGLFTGEVDALATELPGQHGAASGLEPDVAGQVHVTPVPTEWTTASTLVAPGHPTDAPVSPAPTTPAPAHPGGKWPAPAWAGARMTLPMDATPPASGWLPGQPLTTARTTTPPAPTAGEPDRSGSLGDGGIAPEAALPTPVAKEPPHADDHRNGRVTPEEMLPLALPKESDRAASQDHIPPGRAVPGAELPTPAAREPDHPSNQGNGRVTPNGALPPPPAGKPRRTMRQSAQSRADRAATPPVIGVLVGPSGPRRPDDGQLRDVTSGRPRPPEPVVHVTIGSIEVRAVPEQAPTASAPRPSARPHSPPVMSLDDYVRQRVSEDGR